MKPQSGRPGPRGPWRILAVLVVLVTSAGGCATSAQQASPTGSHVSVILQDFKLTTSVSSVNAGTVSFDVTNNGPSTHEFNVDRTSLVDAELPIDDSGLFVDESSPLLRRKGSVESALLGTHHRLTLTLAPGQYVVYCNLEGHYLSGMHWIIDVH